MRAWRWSLRDSAGQSEGAAVDVCHRQRQPLTRCPIPRPPPAHAAPLAVRCLAPRLVTATMLGKKIHKEMGAEPTELEEQVAQVRLSRAAVAARWGSTNAGCQAWGDVRPAATARSRAGQWPLSRRRAVAAERR